MKKRISIQLAVVAAVVMVAAGAIALNRPDTTNNTAREQVSDTVETNNTEALPKTSIENESAEQAEQASVKETSSSVVVTPQQAPQEVVVEPADSEESTANTTQEPTSSTEATPTSEVSVVNDGCFVVALAPFDGTLHVAAYTEGMGGSASHPLVAGEKLTVLSGAGVDGMTIDATILNSDGEVVNQATGTFSEGACDLIPA